jgi:hypothetical protein
MRRHRRSCDWRKRSRAKGSKIDDVDLQSVHDAGLTDGEITEVIANVALNVLINYFNHVAQTEIDFPKVELAA